jgi:hypothetical protein
VRVEGFGSVPSMKGTEVSTDDDGSALEHEKEVMHCRIEGRNG